jgi:hypothetical protein
MALKNIIITGSIGTYPTLSYGQKMYVSSTDEQSFPIEEVIGSNGGSLPNLFGQTSSVDLYVNIDQKWSGYNDTQAGLVEYTQSFQNEFVNGEFSGSVLTVSRGNLNDPECEEFLQVNTTEIGYDPFLYYTIIDNSTSIPQIDSTFTTSTFLDPNTSPNNGEIFVLNTRLKTNISDTYFIDYIKISRFDNQGNNNTISLQELDTLRIKFSDAGIIDFPLFTISEYPTYYLYTTYVTGNVTSTDNNVITHQFSASAYTAANYLLLEATTWSGSGLVPSIDVGSCFNTSSYVYSFKDTPNVNIIFTGSVTFTLGMDGYVGLYQTNGSPSSGPFYPVSVRNESFGAGTYYISASFSPIAGYSYVYRIINESPMDLNINNMIWMFTQSISPNTSSNLTVLEPYLGQNFAYSDCDVLIGNAENVEYDSSFFQVNYEGTTIPTNQQQILSRSAELAPVKSYNYTATAQVLPRYKGSRFTSDAYNTSSIVTASLIQSSYPQYLNAKSYGYTPIDTYDTAIFEFNGGNPTVEVSRTSRVDISNILNVDNTASVSTIYSSDSAFGEIIEEKIQLKTKPIITQYSSNEIIVPADVRVVTNDISPTPVFMSTSYPQDWSYISGSAQDNSPKFIITGSYYKITNYIDGDDFKKVAYVVEGTINTDGCVFLCPDYLTQASVDSNITWSNNSSLSRIIGDSYGFQIGNNPNQIDIFERSWYVYKDPNGDYYPKGSVTTQVISQSIAEGLNKGERWFISTYDTLFTAPINVNTITPLINDFTASLDAINYPLAYSSAYEINNFYFVSGSVNILEFSFKSPISGSGYKIIQGPPTVLYGGNNVKLGLLIWKSPAISNTILFNGTNLVSLGLGNIITDNTSPTIKDNLNFISKTFGSKP